MASARVLVRRVAQLCAHGSWQVLGDSLAAEFVRAADHRCCHGRDTIANAVAAGVCTYRDPAVVTSYRDTRDNIG